MIISLLFLLFGGGFMWALGSSFWKMLNTNWDAENMQSSTVLSVFKWPLIMFGLFLVFVLKLLPILQANGIQ